MLFTLNLTLNPFPAAKEFVLMVRPSLQNCPEEKLR